MPVQKAMLCTSAHASTKGYVVYQRTCQYKRLCCVPAHMPVQTYYHNETIVIVFIMVVADGVGFGIGGGDTGADGCR